MDTNNSDNNGSNSKGFDYDFLVEESLKNVVKKVLFEVRIILIDEKIK